MVPPRVPSRLTRRALLAACAALPSPAAAWAHDDDDDRGGSGEGDGHSGGSERGGGSDRGRRDVSGQPRGAPHDIAVTYPDGWMERIAGDRYELVDDLSRLVVRRPATVEDFSRMERLR